MFTTPEAVNAEVAYRRELMKGSYRPLRRTRRAGSKRVQIGTLFHTYLHTLGRSEGSRSLHS
jgi:hypothetical protein